MGSFDASAHAYSPWFGACVNLRVHLQVPAVTSASRVTELVDSIRAYICEKDYEWSSVDLMFSNTDFEQGHLTLDIWPTCKFPAHEFVAIFSAKSRLLLFIHAYMHSAGIEYVKPTVPICRQRGTECKSESPSPGPSQGPSRSRSMDLPFMSHVPSFTSAVV